MINTEDMDNNVQDLLDECAPQEVEDEGKWSEAAVILNNEIYGNYVVASRLIKKGELLIEEYPLTTAAYGVSDLLPFCLLCGKDLALTERCSKCKWPICDNNGACENDPEHADGECRIFVASEVRPKHLSMSDYGAIEVLRGLLLRAKNPAGWKRLLTFESHSESRKLSQIARDDTEFIISFIRNKCKLIQFDCDTIDRIIGVYSVNTFWAFKDTGRYASLLFDKVTLLAHDCDPNTRRQIIEKEVIVGGRSKRVMFIQITADRIIEPGELITIYYTNIEETVTKRQEYLNDAFYFTCKCNRCIRELIESLDINGNN